MKNHDISELFEQFLHNKCTAAEIQRLLDHFNLDEDDKSLNDLVESEFKKPVDPDFEEDPQVQAVFLRVQQNLRAKLKSDHLKEAQVVELNPNRFRWLSIAASIMLISLLGYFGRNMILNWLDPVVIRELTAANGERKQLRLEDGTTIWLNPGSTLSYPSKFRGKTREIHLSGEAFFEVAKDKEHPFVVHSGKVNTQVLGTSFNIRSYTEQSTVEITLLTGKVTVGIEGAENQHAEIKPNQRVTFNKNIGSLIKQDYSDAQLFLARRNGQLIYKGTPLRTVINDLQLFYNVKISMEAKMDDCQYYGNINTTEETELAIRQIALTFSGKYSKIDPQTWEIVKTQCHN